MTNSFPLARAMGVPRTGIEVAQSSQYNGNIGQISEEAYLLPRSAPRRPRGEGPVVPSVESLSWSLT